MLELTARTGETRRGLPVSLNVAPPPDLLPYIARFYVTIIDQPDGQVIEDMLLSETALVRVLVRGEYHIWETNRGWRPRDGAVLTGAQRRALKVRVRGPLATAGFVIRPQGWFGLDPRPAHLLADTADRLGGDWGASLGEAARDIDDHALTVARLAETARARIAALGGAVTPAMGDFETLTRADPTVAVTTAAERLGQDQRTFERQVRRHFGHTPKLVLRRARFLDMAAVMRGLAVFDEAEAAALRFYDASHLNKEFRLFVDMTPAAFAKARTPLMTPGLEVRQRRKLQERGEVGPAPWQG